MAGAGSSDTVLDESFLQDPHTVYRQLRAQMPVHNVTMPRGLRVWLVTRYADVRAALTHSGLAKNSACLRTVVRAQGGDALMAESLDSHMLSTDPPDHTRLRRLVNRAFTTTAVERLRPRIVEITDDLIDRMSDASHADLVEDFAFPLPITVICELLGIPTDDRGDFRHWTNTLLGNGASEDAIVSAGAEMTTYLVGLLADKRAEPGNDLLSGLILARDDGDELSEAELVSMTFLLLAAGHETTVNLITNGMLALLRNPDQLAALRADRSLLPGAIEEFLRYEGPVDIATMRYTREPVTIGGVDIPADQIVLIALASANRDGDRFADPERFDITRNTKGHLAFGHGIHFCVGAPLARLEAQIAFDRLLDAFPDLSLAADPEQLVWRESTLIRALTTLPVRLGSIGFSPEGR